MSIVAETIEKTKKAIEDAGLDAATLEKQDRLLDMDLEMYCKFQEIKSLAVQRETLTLDEGTEIYHILGEIPDTFNSQPVHVKMALTMLFSSMLRAHMQQQGPSNESH